MKLLALLSTILLTFSSRGQMLLPVINATAKTVSINDGGIFSRNAWSLNPRVRPDTYTADRSRTTKYVTFYTDIDSIRVRLRPGKKIDFIILLNGRDSCFTAIASAIPPDENSWPPASDTIPFTLTDQNAIAFNAILNDKDTVSLHFDAGSWDLSLTKEAVRARTLLPVKKLQIGSLVFNNPAAGTTDKTARGMDGRFGWNLFEGKQVELDYDKSRMIVRSGKRFRSPKGYRKASLEFRRSFLIVKGAMKKKGSSFPADFLLDTGAGQAIILDSAWSAATGYASDLHLIKAMTLSNPKGEKFTTRVVLAPTFELGGLSLTDVPTLILGTHNPVGFSVNFLGNGLLKRFNVIMDFKHDRIYWKPNGLTHVAWPA